MSWLYLVPWRVLGNLATFLKPWEVCFQGLLHLLASWQFQWFLTMTLDFLDISPESGDLCPLSCNLGGFVTVWTSKVQTTGQHNTSKTEWLKHLRPSANRQCSYHCICWNTCPWNPKPPWKKCDSHVVKTPGHLGRPHLGALVCIPSIPFVLARHRAWDWMKLQMTPTPAPASHEVSSSLRVSQPGSWLLWSRSQSALCVCGINSSEG